MDVSDLPAGQVEAYVERAIDDGYREYSLERRGTKTTLTAVRKPPVSERKADSDERVSREADHPTRPDSEWIYAVFATESTPQ